MRKWLSMWVAGALLAFAAGCTTPGNPGPCIAATALLGGVAGAVAGHQGEGETDEELAGAGIGAVAGTALGYLVCGGWKPAVESAEIRVSPRDGDAPLRVNMAAIATPPDAATGYAWELGDGGSASGANVTHVYEKPGTYPVRVRIADGRGGVREGKAIVEVRAPVSAPPPETALRRRVVLRGLNFAFDSAQIAEDAEALVTVASEALREQPDLRVRIVGHTDATGTDDYNLALSQRRADAVRARLESEGISADRLEVEGRGEAQPVAGNETDDGKRQNRRVEFEILP
jgi:OmpA-OmpF porin, OOP family